jgi:ATP-dependent Clp protease ATP-binding subunit ClpC
MPAEILDKFTGHLKNVLAKAHSLAAEMESPGINPEHLVLSLLYQKGSVGGEVLRQANLSAEEIRRMLRLADELAWRAGQETPKLGRGESPKLSAESRRAIEKAVLTANVHEHRYVGTEHLLSGLLQIGSPSVDAILAEQSVDMREMEKQVENILKSTSKFPELTESFEKSTVSKPEPEPEVEMGFEEERPSPKRGGAKFPGKGKTPALEFFSVELTDAKAQEKIDPVIGREKEIERLIQVLCRRTKNNPVLLGEAGVGKTAIVEGLAKRIVEGKVPPALAGKRLFSLDLGLIIAGTIYRGEFEGRLKQIVDEVKSNPDIVLFVDELHNITGAGSTNGSLDAANLLKPALARGDLRCIGATTLAEFKKSIESDSALERRFQPIAVDPPSPAMAKEILEGIRPNYEAYHSVTIGDDAIDAAVALSERYITDRFLPDKAIDLIDEAAACVRVASGEVVGNRKAERLEEDLKKLSARKRKAVSDENFVEALELKAQEKKLEREIAAVGKKGKGRAEPIGRIGRKDIAEVVSRATGVPLTELLKEERQRLLKLEEELKQRIVGQDDAVRAVSELVRRAKAGIASPNRPLASFLFLGPSGVGKTELAKSLADIVLGDPDALVRIDMSEFAEGFNISKLIGAPAGYVGYKDRTKLTDAVKRKPHAVVLFDEIEKAHDEVHNLLLQILEDGHITDATGRKINFKNSIVVMTSNVGASELVKEDIGFGSKAKGEVTDEDVRENRERSMKELEKHFRPEFINRIDRICVFRPLSRGDLEGIAMLQISELSGRLERDYGIALEGNEKVAALIAEKSWNPLYGARGVRREIQEMIETPLAKDLLAEKFRAGDRIGVSLKDGEVCLAKKPSHARATAK